MKKTRISLRLPNVRFDERDTMFARAARVNGTLEYAEYYSRHSELQEIDDRIRSMPALLSEDGLYYNAVKSEQARTYFDDIKRIAINQDKVKYWSDKLSTAKNKKRLVRRICRELGAVNCGITRLNEEYIYSHKGRFDEDYGRAIDLSHVKAIVFLVEMDYSRMQEAPRVGTILESARQYYRAAVIARTLAAILVTAGYDAKAHYDAAYDIILPPLAVQAGLGELGRNNILVADKYGSRVRIGAVTTGLELPIDQPRMLGVENFCRLCRKCARNCPPQALSEDSQAIVRGIAKWPTKVEKCYTYWRRVGTDCGICMAVCPFSHRSNFLHNAVRWTIRHFRWSHRTTWVFEKYFYGP